MFHLRRFRWKRRRAALALLPAAAMMVTMALAGAAIGTGPAPSGTDAAASGGPATVKFDVRRHVMVGDSVVIHGRVNPADKSLVLIKVGGKKVKAVHSQDDGSGRAGVLRTPASSRRRRSPGGMRSHGPPAPGAPG